MFIRALRRGNEAGANQTPGTPAGDAMLLKRQLDAKMVSPLSVLLFFVTVLVSAAAAIFLSTLRASDEVVAAGVVVPMLVGCYILFALRKADQWEKAVVLRNGKFRGLFGPGLFWVIPIIDQVPV